MSEDEKYCKCLEKTDVCMCQYKKSENNYFCLKCKKQIYLLGDIENFKKSDFFGLCNKCGKDIFMLDRFIMEIEGNYYICENCYTDDSVSRILKDAESMNALKLLKERGYSIDKICMMLEKYDFA